MFVHAEGQLGFRYTKYQVKKNHVKVFFKEGDIEEILFTSIAKCLHIVTDMNNEIEFEIDELWQNSLWISIYKEFQSL